jgi:diguanylate cyclase (GGDEF)-like protein/PAS domain S-box-containing protein
MRETQGLAGDSIPGRQFCRLVRLRTPEERISAASNKARPGSGKAVMGNQAEANLTALIESTEDHIWSVGMDYRLIFFNRAFQRHIQKNFGVRAATGMQPEDLFPPERAVLWPGFFERALSEGPFKIEHVLHDGHAFEIALNPIFVDAKATGVSVFGKDITERRTAEEVRNKLASIVESSDEAIHSISLEGTVLSWNRGAENLCGYASHEIIGKHIAILAPPEFEARIRQDLSAIAGGGTIKAFDTLVHRKDGSEIDASVSLSPIRNAAGEVMGVSVIARDISEKKRIERALQDAEIKYRTIFDGALEGMFQATMDGRLLIANRAAARMLGYDSPDDLISSIKDLSHDVWANIQERSRYIRAVEENGAAAVLGFECQFKRKNGTLIWVSLNGRAVRGTNGQEPYYEGFISDITERKRAEETIRENVDLLTEAQRIGALGVYVLDVHAGQWTSSSVLDEIFGIGERYDRSVAGWVALLHPDDRAMMAAYFEHEVIGKRKGFDKEYRIVRQIDQEERWVHGMGKLEFDALEQPTKMRGIIKDITERKRAELQLRDNEERYRDTFEQAGVGILHTSLEGRILHCNERFAEIIGYPLEEVCRLTFQQITPAEDLGESVGVLKQMQTGSSMTPSWEKRYVRKDGSLTWIRLTVSTRRDSEGRALHFISVVEDINARKAAERRLAEAQVALRVSEERYRTAFQTSIDAIAINHLSDGEYVEVNQAFVDISGYPREELIGHTSLELGIWTEPGDRLKMTEALRLNSACRNLETQFRRKNRSLLSGVMSASMIEFDSVPCVLSVTRDISETKAAEEQIRSLAFYDHLTNLPNRRLLLERLRQTLPAPRTNCRRALLTIDLDDLKSLNEIHGHQTGDLILQEVARRLVTCIREPDTVARLGGDEFVVVLEDLSAVPEEAAAQAEDAGEKILAVVGRTYLIDGRECHTSSSIGITVFGCKPETANDLLQQADIALDHAKTAGGNTMRFFAPALQAAVNARAAMEEDLRQAIKSDQFVLFYQPQVNCARWIGAEALIRWNHPRRGLLFPDEFIPLAEETGLILPLGNWVLETACAQIAAWARGPQTADITVSVNISAREFRQPDFVEKVLTALARTGAAPECLELELTESVLVDDIEDVIAKMTLLKSRGLRFSLDDFGTGYSSLAYLKRLPLDQLKIDRSFVRDILVDDSSGAIAQAIISLSRAMGLSVIAEGVETEDQWAYLTRLACQLFQGYLFSRPLPLDEFERLWQNSTESTALVL